MTDHTVESGPGSLHSIASADGRLGLLVSVRNAEEAAAAMAGGASVIDVKEPANGPLGAAAKRTLAAVVELVDGRVPVTAAGGELAEPLARCDTPSGLAAVKVGLAGLAGRNWKRRFQEASQSLAPPTVLIPAAYADSQSACAPAASEVLCFAADHGLGWMVLDTWDKSRGDLFDAIPPAEIADLVDRADEAGVRLVLAGSLGGEAIDRLVPLSPALIGVRGAACQGGRTGVVQTERVGTLVRRLSDRPATVPAGKRS